MFHVPEVHRQAGNLPHTQTYLIFDAFDSLVPLRDAVRQLITLQFNFQLKFILRILELIK